MSTVINVGIVGTGFIAETRARAYSKVAGYDVRIVAVSGRNQDRVSDYARRHGAAHVYDDPRQMLERSDLDIVDLCVPNSLHRSLAIEAAHAGKHVVCPKPLTVCSGIESMPDSETMSKEEMRRHALDSADQMIDAAKRAKVLLMYAENWVYAPSIRKAARLAAASDGVILEMRGGECHSGSHSEYAKSWRTAGGGALLRLGIHPIDAMVHLKRVEGMRRRQREIEPQFVTAEIGDLTRSEGFSEESRHWIATGWADVENWACVIITFDDGTRGIVWASDGVVGGMESSLQVLLSNSQVKCRMSQTDLVHAYAPDPSVFESEYLAEKLETKAGWSPASPDEDWMQGHTQMIQDFVESVATDRQPLSDGALGRSGINVVYGAYMAATSGHRVEL